MSSVVFAETSDAFRKSGWNSGMVPSSTTMTLHCSPNSTATSSLIILLEGSYATHSG